MVAFANYKAIREAEENGQTTMFTWRKQPTQVTGAGIWFDLSMSPGNPVPNYYASAPNVAARLKQSTDGGIYHGVTVAPYKKKLMSFCALTATAAAAPLPMLLCDYLLYYPFIDMSVTDPQSMDNTVAIDRYVGIGGQIMAVVVAGQTGGVSFNVTYTNQNGVAGRVTPDHICNAQALNGTIITTAQATAGAAGPFMALQAGDSSVRSIQQVAFLTGDVGLITLVIIKPLQPHSIMEITAPVEITNWQDYARMPEIQDDAYLNTIACPSGSLSGAPIHGWLQSIWSQ